MALLCALLLLARWRWWPTAVHFDIAVYGGTPEGVMAAVAAAREGKRVLLAEPRDRLGGIMVHAWLNTLDMSRGPDGRVLNEGLFLEWYRQVEGESFDVDTAAQAFHRLVQREPGITLWLNAEMVGVRRSGDRVGSVALRQGASTQRIVADRFIDATADSDLAAAAGVGFTRGEQAATLVFRLTGVDWERARQHVAADWDQYTGATERSLWGYWKEMQGYRPASERIGIRGLNVGRQRDGSVLVNALWIFGADPLDPESVAAGLATGRAELPRVVEYLRRYLAGFEQAALAGSAPELYIRESRHMAGALYQLTLDDVLENRDQPDAIAHGSYPVDVQAARPGEGVTIYGAPTQYAIPLRSLVPLTPVNLLVASRSAGYTHLAHGSARTLPVGMAVGQAAGVAAAVSLERQVGVPDLGRDPKLVREVQSRLRAQGVRLAPFRHPSPLAGEPYADDVRHFRRAGLVAAGYANDYRLDEPVSGHELSAFLDRAAAVFGRTLSPHPTSDARQVTVPEALRIMHAAGGQAIARASPPGPPNEPLTWGMLYHVARDLLFP